MKLTDVVMVAIATASLAVTSPTAAQVLIDRMVSAHPSGARPTARLESIYCSESSPPRLVVNNPTRTTRWHVNVRVSVSGDESGQRSLLAVSGHIPYLPARSTLSIEFSCPRSGAGDQLFVDFGVGSGQSRISAASADLLSPAQLWVRGDTLVLGPGRTGIELAVMMLRDEDAHVLVEGMSTPSMRQALSDAIMAHQEAEAVDALLRALAATDGGAYVQLVSRALVAGTPVPPRLLAGVTRASITELITTTRPEHRRALIALMGSLRDSGAIGALVATLADDEVPAALRSWISATDDASLDAQRGEVVGHLLDRLQGADAEERRAVLLELFEAGFTGALPGTVAEALSTHALATDDIRAAALERVVDDALPVFLASSLAATHHDDFAAVVRIRDSLVPACVSPIDLVGCGTALFEYRDVVSVGLHPRFLESTARALEDIHYYEELEEVWRPYERLGVPLTPFAERACSVARYDDPSMVEVTWLSLARRIDPEASCVSAVDDHARTTRLRIIGALAVAGLAFAGAVAVIVMRWRRLRSARSERPTDDTSLATSKVAKERLLASDHFPARLAAAMHVLERSTPSALAVRLRQMGPQLDAVARRAKTLIIDAVDNGEVRSMLVHAPDLSIYVLVFPARHDQPATLRRYAALEHGWADHVARIRALARSSGAAGTLVTLGLFVDTEGREGVAYASFDDGAERWLPHSLLDDREIGAAEGETTDARAEL